MFFLQIKFYSKLPTKFEIWKKIIKMTIEFESWEVKHDKILFSNSKE
jgi:hypothetical protein